MQKFVVGPGIGGASISWGAAKYLVQMNKSDPVYGAKPDEIGCSPINEKEGDVGVLEKDLFSPLLSAWWHKYVERFPETRFVELDDAADLFLGTWSGSPVRELLVPYLDCLNGDYARLDTLNGGVELRIAEVPEGYQCGVIEDPDTGCEVVEEYPRIWHALPDDEYRFVRLVRNFCSSAERDPGEFARQDFVYEISGLKIALHGDYGMAKCRMNDGGCSYLLLKKNTYYCATEDHGKECYEILGDRENKFSLPRLFRGDEEMKAYFSLLKLLEM